MCEIKPSLRRNMISNREPRALQAMATFFSVFMLSAGSVSAAEETNSSKRKDNMQDLDAILVTGEKVNRTIYDTGSSVEIFDHSRIESMPNAVVLSDLLRMTANVVDTGIGNDLPTVRGIDGSGPVQGAYAFLSGSRPRLNLSLDGRSLTYNELAFGPTSLWDMERVEVFRGPQSYIQGRNAIAGAIVMASKIPSFEWESAVKGAWGNQDSTQAAAMLSGPLVEEQIAFRLSIDRQRRLSHVKLIPYEPVGDPRRVEVTTARAKLLFNPAGLRDLTSQLSINHLDTRAPQNEMLSPETHPNPRYDRRRAVFETKSTSGIWDLAWEASDRLTLENKVIYTDFFNQRHTALTMLYDANIDGKEVQIEPLARFGRVDDRWRGMVGLRYFRGSQNEFFNIARGSTFDDKTETASAFAELTYALTPQVDVTAASRVEREHRQRKGSKVYSIDFDQTYNVFLPKLDVIWKPQEGQTFGAKVARGYNAGGAGMTIFPPVINYTYGAEYVWNYELYSRHFLPSANLELTSNIFYNDYQDMQLPYSLGMYSMVVRNADKVETYGTELGAIWTPTPRFELNSSIGLLKTEIKTFADSKIQGNQLPRAPAFTANMGARYWLMSGLELSGNAMFSDTYYSQYDNNPRGKISPYWVANVQLAYNFKHGRATLYAQNLFDSDKRIMVFNNDISMPITQQPRLMGAALELHF